MAVNSPTGLLGVRSPIFITWDGTGTDASDIYYFKLEIYAWTGTPTARPTDPVYTIDRTTGFVNSYPTADIAPFLENLFDQDITYLGTDLLSTWPLATNLLWVEVDYDIEYFDDPFVVNDTGTTTRFLVTDGYSDFVDGANKDIGTTILMDAEDKYLYELDTYNMPIYLGTDPSTVTAHSVKFLGSDGTSDTVSINSLVTGQDANDRILFVPAGIPNLQNYLFDESLTGITEPRTLPYYDIQVLDNLSAVITSKRFYVQCEPKYTPVQLQFINRYGIWDSLTFFKASRQSVAVTKESYRQVVGSADSSGYDWETSSRGARTYNHSLAKRTTLNTGFVDESMSDTIEDMLMSDYVLMTIDRTTYRVADTYVIGQDFRAVTIDTQSVAIQKHINDKTINYTLDVSFATPENARL